MTVRNGQNSLWTPELVDRMTAMWIAGKSASLCAAALGEAFSRNAVIGKIHRLGLQRGEGPRTSLRPPPRPRRSRSKPSMPKKLIFNRSVDVDADWNEWRVIEAEMPVRAMPGRGVRRAPMHIATPEHAGGDPVSIAGLRDGPVRQCRYIPGEPTADALYCGADVQPGSTYCAHHHARCWHPHVRRAA